MINKKNVKAKIENKKLSTLEKLDTTQTINCEVFIPKSDSRCGRILKASYNNDSWC